jgi:dTDP-4-amino-4,6-dideoxygalactose transaminase
MVRTPDMFKNTDLAFDASGKANPWYYEMQEVGFNYRISDINCALGLSQLRKLEYFVDRRRELADCYDNLFKPLETVLKPLNRVPNCSSSWHLYVVLIDFGKTEISRAELIFNLNKRGIGTQVHYIPVQWQPYYRTRYGDLNFPGARKYYDRCLSLPLSTKMTRQDVERVAKAVCTELGFNEC